MSYFTVAGVSVCKGEVKVRFCSDLVLRIKNLQKQGDTDIQLVELPQPMDKWHACEFLLNSGQFTKYAFEIVEIQGKKLPKATNKVVSAPKVEIDEEFESIKELAAA
jgi:hypothetical protein